MAAPQQHTLTNTSCAFSTSSAAFSSTAETYGSGQSTFCDDFHGRVSVANDRDISGVVCSPAAVVPQPILTHSVSRKTKPCSLCGTAALRSQSSLVPNSPVSPQEQPVVLLHRLEDGLPEGDVDSLRAFGTIRLLPVHRHCGKVEALTNDKLECDRKCQSATSHAMAPGNLAYKSFKKGNIKKLSEIPAGSYSKGDLNNSLTNEILRNYSPSDDHHTLIEKLGRNTVKSAISEVDSGASSHCANLRAEARVCDNSFSRLVPRKEELSARVRVVSSRHNYPVQHSTDSLSFSTSTSQLSHRAPSPQHQTVSSSEAETLDRPATTRSPLSFFNNISPQTSTSSTFGSHHYGSTSQSCSTQDNIKLSCSPNTPMSVVCSPMVSLTTTALSSSSQNLGSPSAISPPESPSSPASPFSPSLMCSPSPCDRENLLSSCSTEVQQSSSPYSPSTLPSLPASPTSIPSSSETPPSPAPSIDSPPASPAASSSQQGEVSHNKIPRPCTERLGGDLHTEDIHSEAQLHAVLESKGELVRSKIRDNQNVLQYNLSPVSSIENAEELSNKSVICQQEVTQVPLASQTDQTPSAQMHMTEDVGAALQNSETETQADLCSETFIGRECEDSKGSMAEVGHLKPDFSKGILNTESDSVELEKNCNESRNSLMKLVLKVKPPGNQQLSLGPEKKENNKENGIPKIVLTLRGKGPNKEYSCSNRLRNESESCSGENVNSKKHKSKRNKRQKLKDREKTKKIPKGDKYKRHLELFGEDSNDSWGIIPDDLKGNSCESKHAETPLIYDEKGLSSLTTSTLEEAPSVGDYERDEPSTPPNESPSNCAKDEVSEEISDSLLNPVDESLPCVLPSMTYDSSEINTGKAKDRPSVEDDKKIHEDQAKFTENSTQEAFKLTNKALETPWSESKQEETSQASPGTPHSSEIRHQVKQTEGQILRSRRSRHAKNTESGRNSDACLWVSFGVNAPVPLPATDLSNLERAYTCKEKTRLKQKDNNEDKEHAIHRHSLSEVGEKSVPKATHNEWKGKDKNVAVHNVIKKSKQDFDEKNKLPPTEHSDCITDLSHSCHKVQSSSSRDYRKSTGSRIRSPTHHSSRHSRKRPRKSVKSREQVPKEQIDSYQHNPLHAIEKDGSKDQEVSDDSCQEKSMTNVSSLSRMEDMKMESEEKYLSIEPQSLLDPLPEDGNTDIHENLLQDTPTPAPVEHVTQNEVTDKPEIPINLKSDEAPDDLYYRPKKIRKLCGSKVTTEHEDEKKSLDHSERKFSSPEAVSASSTSGMDVAEWEPSRIECDTSEVKDALWKPQEEPVRRDMETRSPQDSETSFEQSRSRHRSPTPQEQDLGIKMGQVFFEEEFKHAAEELQEEPIENQTDIESNCLLVDEDNDGREISKREKEKRKKSRKERRKVYSGPGSRSSVLQEAQHRREVIHEEERGRRLAQEIKGFNWLEQKIKNRSLLPSRPAPSAPASPSFKEFEPPARILATPTVTPSTQFTFGNKEEEHTRKNSFSGSSSGTGLKGHLQTAVLPLVPSSKVTALPKRRPSVGTPTTPPCSASSALCSGTSVPSMTVQGALYTCEPTHFRSEHGRVGPTLEKGSIGLGQEHIHSDKATLYSSTSSTKATLYSVKDNGFEALYDTVSPNAVNYYGSAKSGNIDTQYKVTNSPAICFYGSRKHQETGPHSDKTSSTGPHAKSSMISTSFDSGATTEHQPNTIISPKPDIYSTRNSDWSEISQQDSNPNSSSHQSGCSAGSHSPQRFSHKQALLRRAFQEMLKSDPNDSPTDQAKEKRSITTHDSPTKTEMNKADGSKSEERETTYFTSSQSTSEKTSPADTKSLKSISPEGKPSLPSYEFSSETPEGYRLSDSFDSVAAPIKSEDQSNSDLVCTRSKMFISSSMSEDAERAICKLDASNKTMESEKYPNTKENHSDLAISLQNVNDDKNEKDTGKSKDLQSNVIDRIISTSADVDMKVLQDEICNKVDEKNKEDAEVQPSMLLSVLLYKELMKTRQEVEKLRKVQELMLTEKGEKKEDTAEHDSENKIECEKIDENLHSSERILEKRKDHEICDDAELKIDYDEGLFHESKRSKISIRSDLLPTEANAATSSDTLASQKSISYTHESSSPTVTDPSMAEANMEISVITLEGSIVPNTSHPSLISSGIPASPGLSSSISVPPRMISSLPTGHARTSPGIASPGASRTSPGILKPWMPSPTSTRASPGTPKSNSGGSIASPGISISPAMSNSPGIPRNSPVAPRSSPGVLRMSPGLMRINYEIPRRSPGEPMIGPGSLKIGRGSMRSSSELTTINHGTPQMSPTLTQGNICNPPSTENLQISDSHSAVTTVQPKMTTVQSIISPVVPIPRYPQTPITSSPVPLISPKGGGTNCPVSRISPSTSKIDTAATVSLSMTDIALTNMSPSKLRSAFGISNSEVELMPVSVGAKQPLHEPQPQTFLKLVEDQHQTTETPLLLNAVHGVRQETVPQDVESTSHGSVPCHKLGCHEDPKRIIKTRQYGGEMKRHTFSTSDLPDHAPSACKQPPPLKPVSALLRRHSDNRDIHSMIHHQGMYPGTHKNFGGPLHFSTSAAELKHSNPVHPLNQPQYNPAQYPLPSTGRRRNSENDTSETNREYQQAVSMGMQHQHSLIAPGSSVTRSLGPDKATIFPVPPTMPTAIRPCRPRTPPSVTRAHHEQFQNENFYRLNYSFFEKIRERFAHSCDNELNAMDRLQPSTNNSDKFLHPQTFVPRVLVRESIPEVSSHIPTTTFTTSHFPNPNHQAPPNVMPSHQNPFSSNMHPGSSIHHMAQHRRHTTPNQATSSIQHINSYRSGEKFCHYCPQQARYVCSGCKKVWYCSEQCQRDHWSIHGAVCVL